MEKPVCGTCGNGSEMITYPNNCILKHIICSNPNAAIEGRCPGKCPCPATPFTTPTRPFPRVTYWTTKPSTHFHHNGIPVKNCNRLCPYIYDAVCGSNGLTYSHKCMLENAACENPDKNILIKCNKECPCVESTFKDHSKIVQAAQQIRSGHARGSLKSGGH